jgi:hypothetical protein
MWIAWRNPAVWIPLALGLGVAVVLAYRPEGPVELLVGAVALAALVAVAARPFWGVCLAVLLDLYFSYVQALGVPPRNYLLAYLVALAVVRAMRGGAAALPRSAYRLALATGLLVGLAAARTLASADSLATALYGLGGGLGAGVAIAATTARFVGDEREACTFVRFVTICLVLSSLVALLQFGGVETAWRLRELLGVEEHSAVGGQILERWRVPGLAYFAIQLSYQLVTVIPIVGSVWLAAGTGRLSRRAYGLACATMALGLAATLTRSSIAAAAVGMVTVILLAVRRRRWLWLAMTAVAAVAIVGLFDLSERRGLSLDQLSADRLAHFVTALWIARDNPLGIGSLERFSEYAVLYYAEIADLPGAEAARRQTPHNQFLNVLISFGVPGLIGLLWFYGELFRLLARVRRHAMPNGRLRAVASGLTGAFVAYLANASFHNPGPFSGDLFNWYWVGLTVALVRMAERGEGQRGAHSGGT